MDRSELLAGFAQALAARAGHHDLVASLAIAFRDLTSVHGVSITLDSAGPNRITLACTNEVAARLEELQDMLAQGVCWDAAQSGQPQVTDLGAEADQRWPEFGPQARTDVGRRTIYAIPMQPGGQTFGTLSAHLLGLGELAHGLPAAQFLANLVGAALAQDPQAHQQDSADAGPWSGRESVHQATGMVISQLAIPPADALAILRAHAFAHETTLDRVAAQVLDRTLIFGETS